ncbi:putative G2/M phase checkpoint control protein Sum2 [Paecilomyces variotii]|uniref:Putative G2/M phase checkpoint control protein Sum2 n=1 Tax=Byssochlamys spectabilis TaxID=264951 RepID=A0A443HP69_BYSSP|nr:putative G2/M phase checkpoint control protein Sum2 [Paecilomyces variotii]KAJ9227028.1 hypothetical protein DTO169C6_783 [Paecilomyces variotii]KAJ9262697.1 hypothetical protein DTO195F2_3418 [Paecilomyces variotii]KAJ9286360.1 hypothetical protein DTO021C3_6070 [Paecilomyces variotii]KAJ9306948.1 hypothetical protein DTO217A2_3538 [Paecilomyces variotii]KAJ9319892.1 hypothetical protein DTO027B3_9095 [Paecilomyces variotii]
MDMNHLIGQRFNLISKSDIRYVGTLHEINPEASTIALENVISHGTEGRRGNPAEEIPASTSVYEYIVFRGSDVKDISVAEDNKENNQPEPPQVPNDPAILGSMSRPGPPQALPRPQQPQQSPGPRQPPPGYPQQPQFQGFYPPYGQRFGPPGYPPGPGFPGMPYGAPPGWYPPPGQGFPQPPGQFPPQMPLGAPGQRPVGPRAPGTPGSAPSIPQPTSELPGGDKASSKPVTPAPGQGAAPPPPVESKPSVAEAVQASAKPTSGPAPSAAAGPATPSKVPPNGPKSGRVVPAIPLANPSVKPVIPAVPNIPAGNAASQSSAQAAITEATRAATAAVAAAMAKLPQPNAQNKPQQTNAAVDNLTKKMSEVKVDGSNRGQRGGYQNARGGRGAHRGQFQGQTKKVEVPTTDYDFESANAKFNKQDLLKEAIASGSPVAEPEDHVNGTAEAQTGADGAATLAQAAYNKKSSFFDNISSESRDREEGTGRGREWRGEEEKRNIETFGQGSVDGYRGGYRNRGRGRGYGGQRGRGGYNRGYNNARGRGGIRGGRGASQATGVPTQS